MMMQTRRLGPDGPAISAIGLGGMLLSIQGRPPEDQAFRVINAALDAGVTLLDTADAFCHEERDFNHNERLMSKALQRRPRKGVMIATKVGYQRPGGAWTVNGRPSYLRRAIVRSLETLGVETLDLVHLAAPDVAVPLEESVGALARLREEGKIRYVGVSNVTVDELVRAQSVTAIASVQNRWNVTDRSPETTGLLAHCEQHRITFFAYSPFGGTLGAPSLSTSGRLGEESRRRRMSPYRLVLAWMLAKSPVAVALPGARRVESITDSALAGTTLLTPMDVQTIEASMVA